MNSPVPAHDLDLALLGQRLEAAGELADDAVLPRAHLVDVDARLLERDAGLAELVGLGQDLGDVQQRLGRDAADVQADAAELLAAVDQRDGQPEVGGAERGRVAARAAAEDGHLDLDVGVGGGRGRLGGRSAPACSGAAAPAPSPDASSVSSTEPSETLSPTLTVMSATLPAAGDGTSIVALSDSSTTSGSSTATSSPGADEHLDDGDRGEVADVRDLDLHHSSTLRRSESWLTRCATKRAASAPSITRWS